MVIFPLFVGGTMRNYRKVIINGNKYPIRCTVRVLGEIQEFYGKIKQFEYDIRGLDIVEMEDGKKILRKANEPSMNAVSKVLPLMINEGILLSGSELEFVTEEEVAAGLQMNPYIVANMMADEFVECFAQKKQ